MQTKVEAGQLGGPFGTDSIIGSLNALDDFVAPLGGFMVSNVSIDTEGNILDED